MVQLAPRWKSWDSLRQLSYYKKATVQNVFVVKDLKFNLLGLPAITALGLVAKLDTTTTSEIVEQFPTLFDGLGNLGEPYDIQLQPGA